MKITEAYSDKELTAALKLGAEAGMQKELATFIRITARGNNPFDLDDWVRSEAIDLFQKFVKKELLKKVNTLFALGAGFSRAGRGVERGILINKDGAKPIWHLNGYVPVPQLVEKTSLKKVEATFFTITGKHFSDCPQWNFIKNNLIVG